MKQGTINGKQLTLAIILSILTYWLFAQSFLNIAPHVQKDYGVDMSIINISVSLTSLLTGIFIVVAGGLADRLGRLKITYVGLALSIIGSALVIATSIPALLLAGRVFQGLSAACLMPATIALINSFFEGKERQKALSYWSFGSYGGTGLSSLFAGLIATYIGWRFIFVISIIVAIIALFLLRGTPESKDTTAAHKKFDVVGIAIFVLMMISINVVITQGGKLGWTNPIILGLDALFIITLITFYLFERKKHDPFIDFTLFSNRVYIGTTIANLLMNTVIGSLALFNIYAQSGLGLTGFQAGLITIPYMIGSLLMIRIGERYSIKNGPRVPLMTGPISICFGILLLACVFFEGTMYYIISVIGFSFIGLGLGFFATPALSTAISHAPAEKVGMASGIIKMTSTLGAAFGIAVVTTVYGTLVQTTSPSHAAMIALITGAVLVLTAFLAALFIIPKHAITRK